MTWLLGAVAHNSLTFTIRSSAKKQFYLRCSDAWCCFNSTLYLKSGGKKCMSILISPLDLFWAVIKAHLPLRISIMISYTDIYEAHRLPGPTSISLIKSAALWIYSKACMINESEDPMQYRRLFHNFKTHSFTLTGSNRQPWVSRRCPSCAHKHLKTQQLLFSILLDHSIPVLVLWRRWKCRHATI